MTYDYWKQIWERKGSNPTTNLRWLDGFENSPLKPDDIADWIIKRLDIKQSDKVLEVGCGSGMLAQYIAQKCKYTGLDFSESLLKKHKLILGNNVVLAEANNIPFEKKYFDKSFAYSVFHYFPDKTYSEKALDEMIRVTKYRIFLGDLPMKSSREEHLLFSMYDFDYGDLETKHCNEDRFNVLIKI